LVRMRAVAKMANRPVPLMVGEKTAAELFDMKTADFLKGVDAGYFPLPKEIGGHRRWAMEDLRSIAEGRKARPDGGLEI
jgi:hypothetical protein